MNIFLPAFLKRNMFLFRTHVYHTFVPILNSSSDTDTRYLPEEETSDLQGDPTQGDFCKII